MTASSAASRPRGSAGGEYRIGRYRVRARLGKGGMGVVYLGRDEALDRDVAIKTLRVEGSPDDESRGRFEIEAKAAARLQHPNIVTVFELGEDRGLPFIAMELLGGQDLETLLRSGEKLSVAERLDIVIHTLRGLDFAHNRRIVHRDIKPSNLRVLDDGGVKILDFGIAKVESASVTQTGTMVGTPFYMSPEHIRGGVLDGRTDVFAVGVILHELFAGQRPFIADDPARILYRIVNEPHPQLPPDVAGPLTDDVQHVIDKALEKDADLRYASAGLMAEALSRVRERHETPRLGASDSATLNQARKLLASNRSDPTLLAAVEEIARTNPDATEAQRLRRIFRRGPTDRPALEETASFPELDATFGRAEAQEPEISLGEETVSGSAETVLQGGDRAKASERRPSYLPFQIALGVVAAAGAIGLLVFLNRGGSSPNQAKPTPTIREIFVPADTPAPASLDKKPASTPTLRSTAQSPKPAPPAAASPGEVAVQAPPPPLTGIEIRSQPAGAAIKIDKRSVGFTPFRADVESNLPHTVVLSLPGYETREVRIDPPMPPALDTTLVREGPPATLVVESSYPLTVSVSGRVLASERSSLNATLPGGTYEVLLESASVFLKRRETVHLEGGGSATLKTPPTGKIGVRATPDNCKIFVDGVFVDYPPILDRNIVAGPHVVTFEWPDGAKVEEKVQIQAGKPSYIMGRKP